MPMIDPALFYDPWYEYWRVLPDGMVIVVARRPYNTKLSVGQIGANWFDDEW